MDQVKRDELYKDNYEHDVNYFKIYGSDYILHELLQSFETYQHLMEMAETLKMSKWELEWRGIQLSDQALHDLREYVNGFIETYQVMIHAKNDAYNDAKGDNDDCRV